MSNGFADTDLQITAGLVCVVCVCVVESALDDLDLNDFGVSVLERNLESSSGLPSVGVMLGIFQNTNMNTSFSINFTEMKITFICLPL